MTRNFQGDYWQGDFDRGNGSFVGFGEFGGPLTAGYTGSMTGNAFLPGSGYSGYPTYGYPSYMDQPYGYFGPYS